MASQIRWHAHPDLPGVRVASLTFGGRLHLASGDAGQPPGCDGRLVGTHCTWAQVHADTDDWPYQGWFRLTGPVDGWSRQVTVQGGILPDALQAAYWRAYSQALEQHIQERT